MNDDELLDEYMAELRSLPVVKAAERTDLLERARGGDARARKQYIEALLLETATLARRESPPGWRTLDAIQEANVVLIRLIDDDGTTDPAEALDDAVRQHLSAMASLGD